jgi:hypothetical protein
VEKLKNIIAITVELVILAAIILFIAVFIGANKTEKSYQNILGFTKSGEWEKALKGIESIPHYKDADELYVYIYPNYLYFNNYKANGDKIKNYKAALNYIKSKGKSLTNINYKKSINELEKTINFKIEENDVDKLNYGINKLVNDSVLMIRKGQYEGATAKLDLISSISLEPVKQELYAYIIFLEAVNSNDTKAIQTSIKNLDPNYSGKLYNEISNKVLSIIDIQKWNSIYSGNTNTYYQPAKISINMKKDDVIKELGSPIKDRVLSNQYGVFEAMTFDNNGILFFENNILKTFKE